MNEVIELLGRKDRPLLRRVSIVVAALAVCLGCYHLMTGFFGQPTGRLDRGFNVTIILIMVYLLKPLGRKKWTDKPNLFTIVDGLCVLFLVFTLFYTMMDVRDFMWRNLTALDVGISIAYIFLVLEGARRAMGWPLVIISGFFFLHARFAEYAPGILFGPSASWKAIADNIFVQMLGIFGTAEAAVTGYIMVFIIFGGLLSVSGAGAYFLRLAQLFTGRMTAGPAKAAVMASSLFGTVSGSAVANVVTTGTITIPLMKEYGYEPRFAGAVEAVASTGGQIMPPIMGAAAFIIAEYLGLPYLQIIKAALIPALLYYLAAFLTVDFRARKQGLQPMLAQLPPIGKVLLEGVQYLAPLAALIIMLVLGFSATKSAMVAIVILVVMVQANPASRMSGKQYFVSLCKSIEACFIVVMACAAAGIVIGCLDLSGIGARFSRELVSLSNGNMMIALILTAIVSLILGMGMPAVGVYVTLSALVIPSLIQMGVPQLAAHLFCFYFGILGFITPPVCVASFAAASLAGAPGMKVGWTAWRMAIPSFIIPFMFVYSPGLLLSGSLVSVVQNCFTAICGVLAITAASEGWLLTRLRMPWRLVLFLAGVLLIDGGLYTDIAGLGILALFFLIQLARKRCQSAPPGGRAASQAKEDEP